MIVLESSTDRSGNQNYELAENRAVSVKSFMVLAGIAESRIKIDNLQSSRSTEHYNQEDRKVNIHLSRDRTYHFSYANALHSASISDWKETLQHLLKWIDQLSRETAIYSLFDCRLIEFQRTQFYPAFLHKLKSKFYRNNNIKFQLDSLWCEDQRSRALERCININLPSSDTTSTFGHECFNEYYTNNKDSTNAIFAKKFLAIHGIPNIIDVGKRGQEALLYVIIHSKNTQWQKQCLEPIFLACNSAKVPWKYYALLYDKISLKEKNVQRYGTQNELDKNSKNFHLCPLEDAIMLNEWRRRVNLPPIFP